MKIYYVVNARMPNEKAHAIQIGKMCEAFIEAGADLTLVVPNRGETESLQSYYKLRVDVPLVRLPVLNLYYRFGRAGYALSSASFMVSYALYMLWKKLTGERFALYTVDMDTFSFAVLPFLGRSYIEIHGPKPATGVLRFLFPRMRFVAISEGVWHMLKEIFMVSPEHILVESNGVDIGQFALSVTKEEARAQLGILPGPPLLIYVGRFYQWKGLEILPAAVDQLTEFICYAVGGSEETFLEVTKRAALPPNMHIVEGVPFDKVPLWLAAADALLVIGTKRSESSNRYGPPMKIFEYLASRRPVIIGGTPVMRSLVSPEEVSFYEPDDAESLARVVREVLKEKEKSKTMSARGYEAAQRHSWRARAERILAFIQAQEKVQ